jgi:hypothetical protein
MASWPCEKRCTDRIVSKEPGAGGLIELEDFIVASFAPAAHRRTSAVQPFCVSFERVPSAKKILLGARAPYDD